MFILLLIIALISLAAWVTLLALRGGFWRMTVEPPAPLPAAHYNWPEIAVLVPARDEARTIGAAITSLLTQDYPGHFHLILIDDHSGDDTAELARLAAGGDHRFHLLAAEPLPPGWSGKLWALETGIRNLPSFGLNPAYVLFTDADISHPSDHLRQLIARAEAGHYDLVSEMVRLSTQTMAEKFLTPAFIFFFRMLYPFAWVNDPDAYTAGAAGGVMLLKFSALARIGGLAALKGALIDDCMLARLVKREGSIHLALASGAQSLRQTASFGDLWAMIARTAFVQLNRSWLALVLTVLTMLIVFVAPPLLLLAPNWPLRILGLLAWALSAYAYAPTLAFYGLWRGRAVLLPLISLVYVLATIDSARRHVMGVGGFWKGRAQGNIGGNIA